MKSKFTLPQWAVALLYFVVLFYYEAVFKISTRGNFFEWGTVFILLFSIAFSGFGYLLATLTKKKVVNHIITVVYLVLFAIIYLVQYFIFKQFKLFYDIKGMFSNGTDAVTHYYRELWALLISPGGLLRIFLYFLPTALYAIFGIWKGFVVPQKSNYLKRLVASFSMILAYLISVLGISFHPVLNLTYREQYDFQGAVHGFGLISALRMDVREMLFPRDVQFEINTELPNVLPTLPPPSVNTTDPSQPTEPIVYGPNVLDIDFSSLEATGTIKNLNEYVATLQPSMQNQYTGMFKGKNLIMITAEAFCSAVIDPELTPTLYRLATKGINFNNHYTIYGAGTTGGEYQHIFGLLPTDGGESFKNTKNNLNYFTMGSQLNRLGYYGKAFHNNDYKYYSRHETHINIGYSDGYMGYGNGMEEYVKKTWPESDVEMFQGTLPTYIDNQPFSTYYMTVSGHSNYKKGSNAFTRKHWDRVAHLDNTDLVKGYLAAQLEFEDAMTYLVNTLEEAGIADDTVIVITSDHYPYGLDVEDGVYEDDDGYVEELYGYEMKNMFDRYRNSLIIWSGCLEDSDPIIVNSPTSTIDILPTLSNLFGTEYDSRLFPGRDVFSGTAALVFDTGYRWMTDYGYYTGGKFTPFDSSIELPEGYVDTVKSIVRNKIKYCRGVLDEDYFRYLFG